MIKNLLMLGAAIIVLAGVLLFTRSGEKASPEGAIDSKLKANLNKLQIFSATDTAELSLAEKTWVTDLNEFPADTGKVGKLISALFSLKDEEIVSRNLERASEYGLDSAARKIVQLKSGDQILTEVLVGKTASTDFNSTYWMRPAGKEIYRSLGSFSHDVISKSKDWINKKFFGVEKDQILSFTIQWQDSTGKQHHFSIKKGAEDKWETVEPMAGGTKPAVENMVNRISNLQWDDFVSETDSANKQSPPTFNLKLTLADGTAHELTAQKGKDNYYAQYPKRKEIVKMARWRLEVLEKTWEEVYEPTVPEVPAAPDSASAQE